MTVVKFSFLTLVAGGLCTLLGVGIWMGPQETPCQAEPVATAARPVDAATGMPVTHKQSACTATADYAAPVVPMPSLECREIATAMCASGGCGSGPPSFAAPSYATPCQSQVATVAQVSAVSSYPSAPTPPATAPTHYPSMTACESGYCVNVPSPGMPYPAPMMGGPTVTYAASVAPSSYDGTLAAAVHEANLAYIQKMFEQLENHHETMLEAQGAIYEAKVESIEKLHEMELDAKTSLLELKAEAQARVQSLEQALREDKALLRLVADGQLTPAALKALLDRDASHAGPNHAALVQVPPPECVDGYCPNATTSACGCGKCGCESCACGTAVTCACESCECQSCACPGCESKAVSAWAPAACASSSCGKSACAKSACGSCVSQQVAACQACPCDAPNVAVCKGCPDAWVNAAPCPKCEQRAFQDAEAFVDAANVVASSFWSSGDATPCEKAACTFGPACKGNACGAAAGCKSAACASAAACQACPARDQAVSAESPACTGEGCKGDACKAKACTGDACPASTKACEGNCDKACDDCPASDCEKACPATEAAAAVEAASIPMLSRIPYLSRLFVNPVAATETVDAEWYYPTFHGYSIRQADLKQD